MKNNYRLKIIYLMCAISAFLSSCKKNDLTELKVLKDNHKNLAIAGDGRWDLLGHGYDMTGELFERKNASKVPIINIDAFYKDYPNRIPTPTDTKGGFNVYYGVTAYDYVKDVNKKQTLGGSISGGDKDKTQYSSTNFSLTNENQNTYSYSNKYSYATYESWFRIKSIDFTDDVTVELLKGYLTPDFKAYLSNYSADEIVKTYGTHVLLGIDIGGRLKYDYKGAVVKETTFDRKLRAVKAGFSIGIAKIFSVDLSSDVSTEEKTTISNETTDKLFKGTFYGGNNSGTSFSGDALGNISQSINLVSWQQSINVNNASLIGINRSVPIDEFITDPVKKQQVKDAVEKYIMSKQIKDLGEVPIYVYYSSVGADHYFSTTNQPTIGNNGDFKNQGIVFYAFSKPTDGTVPVYGYYSSKSADHYFGLGNQPTIGNGDFVNQGIVFYAYPKDTPNSKPVYMYYSARDSDHYMGTGNSPTISNGAFVNQGIVFNVAY